MALISNFVAGRMDRARLHDEVEATYFTHDTDGRKLVQINTSGRTSRENPEKISQTIQLDENSGRQLFQILRDHFGFE